MVAPSATVSAPIAAPEPAPDVSPVPAPVGLGFTVHLAHPRATMQQLTSLLSSLSSLLPGGKTDADSLVAIAIGAPIGAVIDLDQPIDLAASDVDSPDSSIKIAGSAALSDPVTARETLEKYFKWTQTAPAVVRLQPREDAPDNASPNPCMLAPAFGPTSNATRLVCGATEDSVRHLGPYLARTMTRIASSDDVRLEVFVRELRPARKGSTPDIASPADAGSGDPTDKLVDDLTAKLTDDVGAIVLEASSDTTTVDVKLTTRFVDAASPLTRALVGAGTPSAPPPPAFERLPRGASFAWYGRGATATDLAPLRRTLFAGLHAALEDEGYTSSITDTLLEPLEHLALTGGPWVVASGVDLDAARAALDAYASAGKTSEAARARARAALQGWEVGAVEEPAQGWIDAVRAVVKSDALKPTGKARHKHEPQKESTKLTLGPVPVALQLPAGTLHVEARITQNPEWLAKQRKSKTRVTDAVIPHTVHFFVVPDGGRTWFVSAEDPAVAASVVRGSLSSAGDAGTLGTRTDLEVLQKAPASTAGFVSVGRLATWFQGDTSDEGLRKAREALAGLALLTGGGGVPIPFSLASTPAAGGAAKGGDVRLRILFPIRTGLEIAASPHPIF
jgi:hypothetical protein